ncbi:MAG: purine-cytosine permease family protein [Candidatus Hydrogenedentota bacterium]
MSEKTAEEVLHAADQLYEFEREPVTPDKLQPGRYFAGLFAGEHVAGTEFVIGALFVAWGASVFDIFVGLAIGNLMAVLTWTFICAPIAVRTRLTLYWYLRKVAGPGTTLIYNVCNAVLFCILAGAMITVSASAVRIPFDIPPNTAWYPTDFRFVLVVLGVGAVVVTLAILGFKRLAQFASVCSPWMVTMFFAGGVIMLPWLASEKLASGAIQGWGDYYALAREYIWVGVRPDGSGKASFWEVAAFAWVCNLAMHGGLSDMALFRYAKSHWYGLYSFFGMFIGHYLAWIFAGTMGAITVIMLREGATQFLPETLHVLARPDATIADIDPGAMAFTALGLAGIIAVVIAGWTTSNPTLYRAGLAMQAVTPGWPRWAVTAAVGAVTTIIACFPFVFTKLLDFVGLYGLLLVPIGAVVFTEHWVFPRIGLTQLWAEKKRVIISWPALLSWIIGLTFALYLNFGLGVSLFYLFIPVWFLTMLLYIALASFMGARETYPLTEEEVDPDLQKAHAQHNQPVPQEPPAPGGPVLLLARVVAIGALAVCAIWPIWIYFQGGDGFAERFATFRNWLIVPTVIYFIAGTTWAVKRDKA